MKKDLELDAPFFRIVSIEMVDTICWISPGWSICQVVEFPVHIIHHLRICVEKGEQSFQLRFSRFTEPKQLVAVLENRTSSLIEP